MAKTSKKKAPLVTPPVPPDASIESTVPEMGRALTVSTPDKDKAHQEPARGQETAVEAYAAETADMKHPVRRAALPVERKGDLVEVEILRSSPTYAHWPGEKATYPENVANALIEQGFAKKAGK